MAEKGTWLGFKQLEAILSMRKNNKTYNSITAGRYLLALAFSKGKILNMTQVQKSLYIAYGDFLAKEGRVLLDDSYCSADEFQNGNENA